MDSDPPTEEQSCHHQGRAERERQYQHIKSGLEEHGRSEDVAEEIAARTVNKEHARAGEAHGVPHINRRHLVRPWWPPFHKGPGGRRRARLYEEAKHMGIKGHTRECRRPNSCTPCRQK